MDKLIFKQSHNSHQLSKVIICNSDIVKHAIELSILNNKRTFAYIEGILKNWKSCGYKTLDDITTKEDKPKTKEELKKEYAKMGYIYE